MQVVQQQVFPQASGIRTIILADDINKVPIRFKQIYASHIHIRK